MGWAIVFEGMGKCVRKGGLIDVQVRENSVN